MFILTKIADLVQIHPSDLEKGHAQVIEDNINAKYANKVIQKIGLCICMYDLLSASDGLIGNGDGLVNVNVEFRLIVFRPFKNEVLIGRISSATDQGIRIRTAFFDEIFVPRDRLPEGSFFSRDEQNYQWPVSPADKLFYDNHDTVRFRIEEEHWFDQSPLGPSAANDLNAPASAHSPYTLVASMEDPGLGPCLWWDGEGEEEG
ncbi:hypothetical protein OIDMADRAFT_105227 [Oidiodendron maius Zn]|uniref:DNA-directed RNA polymerase subunit n=1 Tax=Oidiodendron maius (strain Zn) TaxID=913774 RepID=A0A0C3CFJ3_OIDMZ|nr:hypothetical protein OIDMADRAFT_105227 [Oidiodendron maius Zn]